MNRRRAYALCLLAASLTAACVKSSSDAGSAPAAGPSIRAGSSVRLSYDMIVNGKTLRSVTAENPLTFVHGKQNLRPGFRDGMLGMRAGETKDIVVPPETGFGPRDPGLIERVPKAVFPKNFELTPGRSFQMKRNGVMQSAEVVKEDGDAVLVDFNHPLAGKTLTFHTKILSVDNP